MKAAIVTFGLIIGFFQSSMFPGITLVGAQTSVPLQTACTTLNDKACVTCDTIGICSATLTDAVVTEKCGTGTYCDATTGTCSATPPAGCEDPCGDASLTDGCISDPLNPDIAFISCDSEEPFSLLCEYVTPPVIRDGTTNQCTCNADTTSRVCEPLVTSATCTAYIPPGVDSTCADVYFYCNALTSDYIYYDCQISGQCFNDVDCACAEPVETTTPTGATTGGATTGGDTTRATTGGATTGGATTGGATTGGATTGATTGGGEICPSCSYLSDGTEDGYYACFEGGTATMGGRMSCYPGLFVKDTCDCVCPSEGCTNLPNDGTETCDVFYSCNTNLDGTIEKGQYNCPEGQCYSEVKCICDVPEPSTTTLGPGVTVSSSCASFDTICPTMRPDLNDTKSYYICGDGADVHMACAIDSLFVYEKCSCLPCQSSGASYTEISCEELKLVANNVTLHFQSQFEHHRYHPT